MGCGQKKQNTETGVHLTERTCSPYNPIIKQIVDDCLGLPIYPVTSVDAVIDEEGNTLRKLLEDGIGINSEELINYINSKLEEVSETYVTSNQFTTLVNQTLPNTYAHKSLETLVWAISALSNIRVDNEDDLYADDNKTPKIVEAVTELQSQMRSILSGGSGDTPSLGQLSATVNLLKEVLIAVASFNEGYNPNGKLGLEGNKLQIIKEILEIRNDIGDLSDASSKDVQGDIAQRINYIYNNLGVLHELISTGISDLNGIIGVRSNQGPTIAQDITTIKSQIGDRSTNPTIAKDIKDIKETLTKKADLDPELSEQCSDIAEDVQGKYKKLKASEYPVTSIYIFGSKVIDFLTNPENTIDRMFVYFPSGTKLGAETGGGTLNFDFNEDGFVNWRDVAVYHEFMLKLNSGLNFDEVINQIGCSETFRNTQCWRVDSDNSMGTLGDLNALIDLVLSGSGFTYLNNNAQTGSITSLNVSKGCTRYIFEIIRNTPVNNKYPAYKAPTNSDNVSNAVKNIYMGINEYSAVEGEGTEYFKVIAHPAIEGKLYLDLGTNSLFRYKETISNNIKTGAMISLNEEDIVCQYLGLTVSNRDLPVGTNVIVVQQHEVFAKPTSQDSIISGSSDVSDLRYSVGDVTALIQFLLDATGTTSYKAKCNVAAKEAFDLQNIKSNLMSVYNIGSSVNKDDGQLDTDWANAQNENQKAQVIVNAIGSILNQNNISSTDLTISDIKAALTGSTFPTGGTHGSMPKPTVIPDWESIQQIPNMLQGASNWDQKYYAKDGDKVKIVDMPDNGQAYNEVLIAKYDINGTGNVTIGDVTDLIQKLLGNNNGITKTNVYYNYTPSVITGKSTTGVTGQYSYTVETIPLKPGRRVFVMDLDAEKDPDNDNAHLYKYRRSYVDYDNCLQPDLDDYNLRTTPGWTILEQNGLTKDVIQSPAFLDPNTNKIGLVQGNKTIYFTINGNTADITVTDTQYNYGGEIH